MEPDKFLGASVGFVYSGSTPNAECASGRSGDDLLWINKPLVIENAAEQSRESIAG